LTKKNIDINVRDIDRFETPLHYAAAAGHITTVSLKKLKNPSSFSHIHPYFQTIRLTICSQKEQK
jgi:hypothetical protein